MSANKYPVVVDGTRTEFQFFSEGPMGRIKKKVMYQEIQDGLFNLSFGDIDESGKFDDTARSNNGDRDKVLMTVGYTVFTLLDAYPGAKIYIEGRTPSRMRLYRMALARKWIEIDLSFDIKGFVKGNWEPFRGGRNYLAFLIARNKNC